jgi:hypothetical protein
MSNSESNNMNSNSSSSSSHVFFDDSDISKLKLKPLLCKSTNILINSGNIVSSNRIKKKTNLISSDEVYECIQSSLFNWLLNSDQSKIKVSFLIPNPIFFFFFFCSSTKQLQLKGRINLVM